MRDQQHAHAALDLQTAQEVENLRLNRHIQRRRRFIGNQQARIGRERNGNHHPLFHATRELEGVLVQPTRRIGNAHGTEQFQRPLTRCRAAQTQMAFEHLADLPPVGQHRVKARCRFLKNHRHAAAAHRAHFGFRQLQQIAPVETHLTAKNAPRRRQQAQQRQGRRRFAAARFAEQRQRFPGTQIEIHAIDRRQHPPPGHKTSTQVTNGKQRHVIHPSRAIARTA